MNAPVNHTVLAEIADETDETLCECCEAKWGVRFSGAYQATFACASCADELDEAESAYNEHALRWAR